MGMRRSVFLAASALGRFCKELIALCVGRLLGDDTDGFAADLDRRARIRLRAVVPGWVLRRSTVRGPNEVPRVAGQVGNGVYPSQCRLCAGVVEDQ
jgi:hypothetical protein